jgi:AraC family transcriptional regulator
MLDLLVTDQPRELFARHVLLRASGSRHAVRGFAGPLSFKSVREGEARWRVGGQAFRLCPGECLITEQGEPYDLDIDAPTRTLVLFFAEAFVGEVAHSRLQPLPRLLDAPEGTAALPVHRRRWGADSAPMALLRRLDRLPPAHPLWQEAGAQDALLREALDALADCALQVAAERERLAAHKPAVRAELQRRVLRGKAWLEGHWREPFNLQAAAREAWLAPHHFHRSFRALSGEAPFAFVRRLRLARAAELLPGRSVAEVAAAVGYASVPSFHHAFRRQHGCTPAQFAGRDKQPDGTLPP